jgi:hypothetical protein
VFGGNIRIVLVFRVSGADENSLLKSALHRATIALDSTKEE